MSNGIEICLVFIERNSSKTRHVSMNFERVRVVGLTTRLQQFEIIVRIFYFLVQGRDQFYLFYYYY